MALKLKTAPTIEPISLTEAKLHLRLDSGTFADQTSSNQSIAPGSHAIAAVYSLIGAAVEVQGYSALATFVSGTNGAGGTVDVKLQDSDDNSTWTDVTSGAFTQVTTANDNATYEKAYTGTKRYLRVVCTVAGNACEFGINVILGGAASAEDALLTGLITAARQHCESYQNRAYITQTWEMWLDEFPGKSQIEIPLPPLQSIESIKYYDTSDGESTFGAENYFVDTKNEPGWVVLNSGISWPSATLRPANGVCITFVAGYGAAAAVPQTIKQAMLLLIGHWYANREAVGDKQLTAAPMAVDALLSMDRVWPV